MGDRAVRTGRVVLALAAVAMLAACGAEKNLEFENLGPGTAVVDTGDQPPASVEEHGGMTILDYDCTPGDVTITFADGSSTLLPGPICSDQRVVIKDGAASLKPAREQG